MNSNSFDVIAKEKFSFLVSDFDFKLIESHKHNWGYQIVYVNKVTGVKVTYEYREAYIFVELCELIDKKIIDNPLNIKEDSVLHCYGLDDLINIRNPSELVKPAYEYGKTSKYYDSQNGLALYVSAFADNLREYASDILLGDFSIFRELDNIVKTRAKSNK